MMGDTPSKLHGQPLVGEVGRCPGWRHHPWNNANASSPTSGWASTRGRSSALATVSAARRATNGSTASTRTDGAACGTGATPRTTVPTASRRTFADLLCAARRRHPDWGPGKLLDWLAPRHPEIADDAWPAVSTAGDLLAREGLVKKRRRRRPHQHPGVVPPTTDAPNDLWTADFKGQFPTRDGVWCYPLTIGDQHTRYLLACRGLPNIKGQGARPVFERTFREFGLPRAIRTDNGVPFASCGIHGLSQLNVWWMHLGIQHQRIHPASPQENGAHERLHRTLKAGACRPPRADLPAQQRAFNRFRALYNDERPDRKS